jgi:hypothetical protein
MRLSLRKLALYIAVVLGAVALGFRLLAALARPRSGGQSTGKDDVGGQSTGKDDEVDLLNIGGKKVRINVLAQILTAIGLILAVGGLIFSGVQIRKSTTQNELSQEQLQNAEEQLQNAQEQLQNAEEQLQNSRYQDVYARQLDLEKLAIEKKELAPYLFGGVSEKKKRLAKSDDRAALRVALSYALDFYAYVWVQIFHTTGDLALRGSTVSKPNDMTDGEWEGWRSWSETIAGGFDGAPDLCNHLDKTRNAYAKDFVSAIKYSGVCPKVRLPDNS